MIRNIFESKCYESLLLYCQAKIFRTYEYSRKSLVCIMSVIVNKQVFFLTSQCIDTCKSAYTKGYALN